MDDASSALSLSLSTPSHAVGDLDRYVTSAPYVHGQGLAGLKPLCFPCRMASWSFHFGCGRRNSGQDYRLAGFKGKGHLGQQIDRLVVCYALEMVVVKLSARTSAQQRHNSIAATLSLHCMVISHHQDMRIPSG